MATAMEDTVNRLVKTGAISGYSGKYVKLYVAYKISQDVAKNQSTITCGMYVIPDLEIGRWGDWSGSYVGTSSLTFDGTVPANTTSKLWLASNKSFTVTHNNDGTGSATIAWKWGVDSSWGGMSNPSGSFTITLPTIARTSSVSATNCYIGDATTITITRGSSSFKHTLQYKVAGQSNFSTIVSKTSSTSYKYDTSGDLATAALSLLSTTGKTIKCDIKCITYNGSTKIGEKTTTITLTGKDSTLKPTINPIVYDTNETTQGHTGNSALLIKYYSNAYVAINATLKHRATVKSYKITNGSKSITTATGTFNATESNVFTFTVTDSRNYTVTQEITLKKGTEFFEAIKPTVTLKTGTPILSSDATSFSVAINVSGKCYCGNLGAKTAASHIYYRYKESGGSYSSWVALAKSDDSAMLEGFSEDKTSYSCDATINGLDYTKQYVIQGRISNTLGAVNSTEITVKASPIFDWDDEGFQFNVPVTMPNSGFKSKGGGVNLNNSDLWGANGIYFADKCSSGGEGIYFPTDDSSGEHDLVTAYGGQLYFRPNYPTNTTYHKLFYTPGDTLKLANNTPFFGFLTSSRTMVIFSIPLDKPVIGATKATFSGSIQLRGIGGYVYNQASNKETKSATFATATSSQTAEGIKGHTVSITGQSILVSFQFNAALTHNAGGTTATTNNTPIVAVPDGTLTITFAA